MGPEAADQVVLPPGRRPAGGLLEEIANPLVTRL
jgi:hypothetical protein